MAKRRQNVTIFKGEDAKIEVTVTKPDPADATKEVAEDIGGWKILATARAHRRATAKLWEKGNFDAFTGVSITGDGSAGIFEITLTAAETKTLPDIGVWDGWRTDTGFEAALVDGDLKAVLSVRQPA